MKQSRKIEAVKALLKHLEYSNQMAPFPVFDTEYVSDVRNYLRQMEQSDKHYDDEPVVACKYCKNLYIVVDDEDNDICMKCNSVNELKTYENIGEYLKEKTIWNDID
jgi:hypothetical protein